MLTDAPLIGDLEISVFSRSYGECITIHLPSGEWIVIDSQADSYGKPIALTYLRSLGLDPKDVVRAILLTHWHDDHVAGAGELVASCPEATIALSGLLQKDEFKKFLKVRGSPEAGSYGTGLDELKNVLVTLGSTKQRRKWCWADTSILNGRAGIDYRFDALSPSDHDFEDFVASLPKTNESARISSPPRNDSSVASVLQVSAELMIFGADLEIGRATSGWRAVHEIVWQQRGKATFFKIAHHGSEGADHAPVWLDMLIEGATVALTPWNRGSKLPRDTDVARILEKTQDAHAAAKPFPIRRPKRLNAVERSLKESHISVKEVDAAQGQVRFRKKGDRWDVAYSGAAGHLSKVLAA